MPSTAPLHSLVSKNTEMINLGARLMSLKVLGGIKNTQVTKIQKQYCCIHCYF